MIMMKTKRLEILTTARAAATRGERELATALFASVGISYANLVVN